MELYLTFHKVLDKLQSYQEQNPALNSFGYGNLVDFGKNVSGQTVQYPLLFIVPQSVQYDENTTTYQLTAIIADRLNETLDNEKDAVSDCSIIARNLVSVIKRGFLQDYFETILPANALPFIERFNDNVAGVALDLNLIVYEDVNACIDYPSATPSNTPTSTPGAPSPTPTSSETPTPTPTPSVTESPVPVPSVTPTETPSSTPTSTPSETPTNTPSETPTETPTNTPSETPTQTPTSTVTETPTNTPTPSNTPSETPTSTPTETPTNTPSETPTSTPTATPTNTPTPSVSPTKTATPTVTPTITPTKSPSLVNYTMRYKWDYVSWCESGQIPLFRATFQSSQFNYGSTIGWGCGDFTVSNALTPTGVTGTGNLVITRGICADSSGGGQRTSIYWARWYKNGVLQSDQSAAAPLRGLTVCPTQTTDSFTFTGVTISAGDSIIFEWEDRSR